MDVDEVISQINTGIEEIQELIVGKNDITHISKPLMQSVNNMTGRVVDYKSGKTTPGITTGFADLNRLTGGFKPSRLIIIAARPGCVKTAIAIHFAMKAATEGKNVVFFTLEMENTELTDRILIRESGVDAERFNSGGIEFKESERVLDSMKNTKRLPIYIEDSARMSVQQIVNRARMLHKQGKCKMVIIDYIQLITTPVKTNRKRWSNKKQRYENNYEAYQNYVEMGLFFTNETVISSGDSPFIKRTIHITGKGQVYFINKFLNKDAA
jgi:replicative DNA helicase